MITVEIATFTIRSADDEPTWREAGQYRSTRLARARLPSAAYGAVSHLSRASYEIRFRRPDGLRHDRRARGRWPAHDRRG